MKKLIFLMPLLLGACIASQLSYDVESPRPAELGQILAKDENNLFYIKGQFSEVLLDNSIEERVFFSDARRPTVLLFSSEFCLTCQEETETISTELNAERGFASPSNVNFYTIMVENDSYAAEDFRDAWGVTWNIGFDSDSLFSTFCTETTTPCVLITDPRRGVLLNRHGPISLEEIESHTGEWLP